MNVTEAHRVFTFLDPVSLQKLTAGWFTETACSVVAIILSLVGLAGVSWSSLAATAVLVLGVAECVEGAGLAACLTRLTGTGAGPGLSLDWGGSIVAKLAGGIGGIAIGALVLLGKTPSALLPLAVLLFGATFLFSSMVSSIPTAQEIAGAVGFVLGLVAILGLHSIALVLFAVLLLGLVACIHGVCSERNTLALSR